MLDRNILITIQAFWFVNSVENPRSIHRHTIATVEDAIILRAVVEFVVVPNESREASVVSLLSQEITVVSHV